MDLNIGDLRLIFFDIVMQDTYIYVYSENEIKNIFGQIFDRYFDHFSIEILYGESHIFPKFEF